MGSAFWEPIYHDHAVTQYHNGRPLSVALTETDEANFSILHPPARSQSVGRRVKRESSYSKSNFTSLAPRNRPWTAFHYPQPMFPRAMNYVGSSGDMFVEKLGKDQLQDDHRRPLPMFCLETVTIEEEKHRPSPNGMLSHVRNCSPVVRQLKIRSRPSSSFNLHERDASTGKQRKRIRSFSFPPRRLAEDQRWSKAIDEQHVEHYQYQYHYDFLPDRIIPSEWRKFILPFGSFRRFAEQLNAIQRRRATIGPASNRVRFRREKKNNNFRRIVLRLDRPIMKDSSTTTADLRKLSRSGTKQLEVFSPLEFRFQKRKSSNVTKRTRRSRRARWTNRSPSTAGRRAALLTVSVRSFLPALLRSNLHCLQLNSETRLILRFSRPISVHSTASTSSPVIARRCVAKTVRFLVELRWKPTRAVAVFSDYDRNRVVVRPTAKPREALVDTASIVAPPTDTPEPLAPNARRNYFLAWFRFCTFFLLNI